MAGIVQQAQAEAIAAGQRDFRMRSLRLEASRRLEAGEPAQAVELYRQLAEEDPDSASAHRDLSLALVRAGQIEAAIAPLERAQRLAPTADGHLALADIYRAVGRTAEADRERRLGAEAVDRRKLERLRELVGGR